MDEWYVTFIDAAGNYQLDCVAAESALHAIHRFNDLQPPIEWVRIVKVELKGLEL